MVLASCLNSSFAVRLPTTLPSSLDPTQFEFFQVLSGFGFIPMIFVWLWFFSLMFCPTDKTQWPILQLASFGTCVMSAINLDWLDILDLAWTFAAPLAMFSLLGFRIPFLSNGLVSRQTDKNSQSSDNLPKHTPHFITNKQTRHFYKRILLFCWLCSSSYTFKSLYLCDSSDIEIDGLGDN